MAKRYMRFRKKPSVGWVITGIVTLGLSLLIGNRVLTSVGTTIGNIATNASGGTSGTLTNFTPFYSALSFLGLADTGGTWSTTAIVGILGLVVVASFILSVVKVSLKGNA